MREIELINKRKKREKHFLKENGEIIAKLYDQDIHYLKNGKYEEIDNTLIENNDYFANKSNNFQVKFNKALENNLMTIEDNDNYLNLKLINIGNYELICNQNIIKYLNVYNGIYLEYNI